MVTNSPGNCLRCKQSLGLLERITEDLTGVSVPGKGELCPNCYRNLSDEERAVYFGN
ncbi:hypothetical protein [Zhaonella formicivorans]|jgi:hypothetical protein|uniref:hypothetical protein n=1 Tax=Zhaonella formicivorans TaxID=2528593 RepID=UPI001D0FDDB9|nr:hypothetical protein [Zhaonella formicivorans]